MEEIQSVIDKLKHKLEALEEENKADEKSISEKQTAIDTLNGEISDLQKGIETRKEDIAKLTQKIEAAETFDKSMEEVAPLIANVEEEKHEEEKEEAKNILDVKAEDALNAETHEEEKTEEEEEEIRPMFSFSAEKVAELNEETNQEEDQHQHMNDLADHYTHEFDTPATPNESGPIFDERGFDISATVNNGTMPDLGLNEMYNPEEAESTLTR